MTKANIPCSTKHLIILHKDDHLMTLIIWSAHERVQHNGVEETLREIHSKYWIVKGRCLIRRIIHKCVFVGSLRGRPTGHHHPLPLPTFWVREEPSFTYTGLDFAGPLHIRTN